MGIYDVFVKGLFEGRKWSTYNPRTCIDVQDSTSIELEYIESEKRCKLHTIFDSRELFERLAYCAWKCGDPGIIFIDKVNEYNPTPHLGKIHGVNPCGETPLLD